MVVTLLFLLVLAASDPPSVPETVESALVGETEEGTVLTADELMDEDKRLAPSILSLDPPRPVRGSEAERRLEFQGRALKAVTCWTFRPVPVPSEAISRWAYRKEFIPWMSRQSATEFQPDLILEIVDGRGRTLEEQELVTMAEGEKGPTRFAGAFFRQMLYGPITLLVFGAVVLGAPMLWGLVGVLAGSSLGFGLDVMGLPTGSTWKPRSFFFTMTGTALGALVGLALGFMTAIMVAVVSCVFQPPLGVVARILAPPPEEKDYAGLVQRHNLRLARELRLEPRTLDPSYFPFGLASPPTRRSELVR